MLFALGFPFIFFCFVSFFFKSEVNSIGWKMRDMKWWNLLRSEVKIIFLESWYYARPAKPRGKLGSLLPCFQRNQIQKKSKNKQCEMREKEMLLQRPSLTLTWACVRMRTRAQIHTHSHTVMYSSLACRHMHTHKYTHWHTSYIPYPSVCPQYFALLAMGCWNYTVCGTFKKGKKIDLNLL